MPMCVCVYVYAKCIHHVYIHISYINTYNYIYIYTHTCIYIYYIYYIYIHTYVQLICMCVYIYTCYNAIHQKQVHFLTVLMLQPNSEQDISSCWFGLGLCRWDPATQLIVWTGWRVTSSQRSLGFPILSSLTKDIPTTWFWTV